jgi:hypothetical protein
MQSMSLQIKIPASDELISSKYKPLYLSKGLTTFSWDDVDVMSSVEKQRTTQEFTDTFVNEMKRWIKVGDDWIYM